MSGTIKNALLVVVMVAIAAASIMLFIKPNIDAKTTLDGEISQLQARLADLQSKEADRAVYEAGIEKNKAEFEKILREFPEGLEQANYIDFLGKMTENKDIGEFDADSWTFSEQETFYTLSAAGAAQSAVPNAQATGTATQAGATTEASAATTEAAVTTEAAATTEAAGTSTADGSSTPGLNDDDLTGIKVPIAINYMGSYKGIKNLLAYIIGNEMRMTIDTMDVSYNEEDKQVSGSMNLNLYAITSASRKQAELELDGVDIGTDNIFDTTDKSDTKANKDLTSSLEEGDKIVKDYDYYVALNPSSSNEDAISIASKSDTSSKISSNVNEVENATIKFFMVGQKYYVSYNIGDVSYPENFDQGTEFDPGDDLNLLIKSSKRKNDKDLSGVKLVVDNETDKVVNVKIDGDDSSNPRVRISQRIGKVKIYE